MSDFEDEIKLKGKEFVKPQILCTAKSCIIMHNLMKWKFCHNYGIQLSQITHIFNNTT